MPDKRQSCLEEIETMKPSLYALAIAATLLGATASAAWHEGRVSAIGMNYDGETPTFQLEGVSMSNCTCSAWATWMCLNPARESVDKEFAMLLTARAAGKIIRVNIDETTCRVKAIAQYE